MSWISRLFNKQVAQPEPITHDEPLIDIKKEDFIDDSDPVDQFGPYSIEYGTRLPIDLIYGFLKEDYQFKAYNDALTNPDKSYKEANMAIIRSELEVKFKQVLVKYGDMLREIEFHIVSRKQAGLSDVVEQLKTRHQTYLKHVEEIQQMKGDLEKGALYMVGIFTSYEVGFTRGLASLSIETLKTNHV